LEERQWTTVDVVVDDGRDLLVGGDRGEAGVELLPGTEVDREHGVREARLLEHDGGLAPVRRRPRVEIDHVNVLPSGDRRSHELSAKGPAGPCTLRRDAVRQLTLHRNGPALAGFTGHAKRQVRYTSAHHARGRAGSQRRGWRDPPSAEDGRGRRQRPGGI